MVFNSWLFFVFFTVVFTAYALLHRRRAAQNWLLLAASCVFYGWWDWRFLFLVGFSTVVDYWAALRMEATDDPPARRRFLMISVVSNLALLGFFKYYNFFADSAHKALERAGIDAVNWRLDIILPVGISFYTFHALSYTIDVYRRHLRATTNFRDFSLFVMFFPQLVAGPIGRASHQLPQFLRDRHITIEGLRQGGWLILWGLFKKVVVADNLASLVDQNFARSASLTGPEAYLTVVAFTYQIYCDFSGYTDIARGSATMMGFDILPNFKRPYASTDPQDFWRRWHISLSSWLRDYLFTSLGATRGGPLFAYRNLMITMILGGLWHGASWNFVWWGVYHGMLLAGYQAWTDIRRRYGVSLQMPHALAVAVMFQFTLFGMLIFRCTRGRFEGGVWVDESYQQIVEFLTAASRGLAWTPEAMTLLLALLLFVVPLLGIEALLDPEPRREDRGFLDRPVWMAVAVHACLVFFIVRYGVDTANAFIYFQF